MFPGCWFRVKAFIRNWAWQCFPPKGTCTSGTHFLFQLLIFWKILQVSPSFPMSMKKKSSHWEQGDHTPPCMAMAAGGEMRGSRLYFGKVKWFSTLCIMSWGIKTLTISRLPISIWHLVSGIWGGKNKHRRLESSLWPQERLETSGLDFVVTYC